MKAAYIRRHGDPSVIGYEEVPRPVPGSGEVLIEVAAAAHNPSDVGFRAGFRPIGLPYIPGVDVSGTVRTVGAGATGFGPGDHVIGLLSGGGALAEYAIGKTTDLAPAPTTVPLADAAAIPVAALTAWQALFEQAGVGAGQRVLLNGAGGGVGRFAVQLAKRAGATVIATAGPHSVAAVRKLGADTVLDYTTTRPTDRVDAAVNLAPVAPTELAFLVRPGGVLVSITVPVEAPPGTDVVTRHMITRNDAGQLAAIVELIEQGALTVEVTERHRLADLALVHRRSEAGLIHGKAIVVP
jgi:NADPH:quinone reductase-like Zn-dependent oxidoreductase